ncbi:MAG: metal ABC transporter permease [Candidatus Sericytochromatia bacterium]
MPDTAIFATPWFWQATLLVAVAAGLCALVGSFLMLRRMSLLSDAVSHSVLPGVVVGYMVAGYAAYAFLGGAVASGLLCVLAIGFLVRRTRLKEDAAMGVVFTTLFALGIVLLSQLKTVDLDPACVIYGEALAARPGSLELAVGVMAVAVAGLLLGYKQLALSSFDPDQARLVGMPVQWIHYGLLAMLALATVAALRAVGIVLAIAFFITPAATAFLLTRRLPALLATAVALAMIESLAGMALAVLLNATPSGVTAALGLGVFVVVLMAQWAGSRGRQRTA